MSEADVDDDDVGLKTSKSAPLTSTEKSILLSLIRDKKTIVESKKTDFGTTGKKQKAWDEISVKFSSQPNCSAKSSKQIKAWWDNTKKRNKKLVSY
jgi:Myb/SANT-like DNA-binding domain